MRIPLALTWLGKTRAPQVAGLAMLFATSLALRLRGIGFGLPLLSNYYIRPDETLLVIPAAELPARLGNPGHVNYPAAFIDVLAVLYRALHSLVAMGGAASGSFLDDVGANPSRYFLAGRVVSACCGAALALVVYRVARRFASPLAAAVAAAWYAVSPLAVREAHFAVTDTPMSLLVGCAVLAAIRVVESPATSPTGRRRALILCGAATGAAVATKYSAAVAVPALAVALLCPRHELRLPSRAKDVGLWLAVSAAIFVVLNPWLMTHPAPLVGWMKVLFRAIYGERAALAADAGLTHGWKRLADYAGLMPGGLIGAAVAAAGVVVGLARCRRGPGGYDGRIVAPLLTALGFVALFAPARMLLFRYLAPLLPLSAILSALALDTVKQGLQRQLGTAVLAVTGLAGIATTAPATFHLVNSLTIEDTRSEAGRWIRANVPASVPIVWLGAPESEPQIRETPASMRRRVEYVDRMYGPVAARVIDRMYLLAMRAPGANDPRAYEVSRNPQPQDVSARLICVVQAAYPSPTVLTDPGMLAKWTRGRIVRTERIGRPLPPRHHLLEPWDAFFLPINLDRSLQPGPRFVISLVDREAGPGPLP